MANKILENYIINDPVADVTALKAVPTVDMVSGVTCEVLSIGNCVFITPSAQVADDINWFDPTDASGGQWFLNISKDIALTADSDSLIPTQHAVKHYVDGLVSSAIRVIGVWDASTNTPTLTAGVGTDGYAYYTNVAGTQTLPSGVATTYNIGDLIYYTETTDVWEKLVGTLGTGSIVSYDASTNTPAIASMLPGQVYQVATAGAIAATVTGATKTSGSYLCVGDLVVQAYAGATTYRLLSPIITTASTLPYASFASIADMVGYLNLRRFEVAIILSLPATVTEPAAVFFNHPDGANITLGTATNCVITFTTGALSIYNCPMTLLNIGIIATINTAPVLDIIGNVTFAGNVTYRNNYANPTGTNPILKISEGGLYASTYIANAPDNMASTDQITIFSAQSSGISAGLLINNASLAAYGITIANPSAGTTRTYALGCNNAKIIAASFTCRYYNGSISTTHYITNSTFWLGSLATQTTSGFYAGANNIYYLNGFSYTPASGDIDFGYNNKIFFGNSANYSVGGASVNLVLGRNNDITITRTTADWFPTLTYSPATTTAIGTRVTSGATAMPIGFPSLSGTGAYKTVVFSDITGNAKLTADQRETVFNGLADPTKFTVTYSAATRIFTVTCAAGAAVTVGGVKYTKTTASTTAHATSSGEYYLYYDASGVLTVSGTPWDLLTTAQLAYVYYNASNAGGAAGAILFYELHPGDSGMSPAAHKNLHDTRGTQLLSGCVASGYTLNNGGAANINWTTTSGTLVDEDIYLTAASQALGGANTYRIMYLTGTSAAPVWNFEDLAYSGIDHNGTDIYYNQLNAGTWQKTAITNNGRYVNYWIVATTAYSAPQILVIMGQTLYTSQATATAATFASEMANAGLFLNEAVILYRVTYRRSDSNGAPGNADIRSFTKITQNIIATQVGVPTVASSIATSTSSFTNIMSAADTNVQLALNTIDAAFVRATWTPVITGSGTAGTYNLTNNYAYYQVCGKMVTAYFSATVTEGSAGSGDLVISGLPLTAINQPETAGVVKTSNITFTGNNLTCEAIRNTTTGKIVINTSAAASAYLAVTAITNAGTQTLAATFTYFKA